MGPVAPKSKSQKTEQKIDIKSRLGYYAEYVTAYYLALEITNKKGKLFGKKTVAFFKNDMDSRKKSILKELNNSPSKEQLNEIERQEKSGKLIAKTMMTDIILNKSKGNDFHTLQFDIILTGDSAKGVSKADVVLKVIRPSTEEIVDSIAASIKSYKTPNINLANNTFTGLLQKLTGDENYENEALSKLEHIIFDAMVTKYMKLRKIKDRQNAEAIVGAGKAFIENEGISCFEELKEAGRKAAKDSHVEVTKLIISEFNKFYAKNAQNKKTVNKNLLKLIGMDGEDDFYAAIGDGDKMKFLSSRQSESMRRFLESVKNNNMNIVMKSNTTGKAIDVCILIDKTVVAESSISFTDTGIGSEGMTKSKAAGKTNFWFNVKTFLEQ